MSSLVVETRSGETHSIPFEAGSSLMETIRDSGLDELLALCGGSCSCATCHVFIDAAYLAKVEPIGDDESDLLDGSSCRAETSRLACQIRMTDALAGMNVRIAPDE
jgi:ferredoxin, 2Fe-2S